MILSHMGRTQTHKWPDVARGPLVSQVCSKCRSTSIHSLCGLGSSLQLTRTGCKVAKYQKAISADY